MKKLLLLSLVSTFAIFSACTKKAETPTTSTTTAPPAGSGAPTTGDAPSGAETKLPSGLAYTEMKVGTGTEAKTGKRVHVHYTGWLQSNNQKFDSSLDRGQPFVFELGKGMVIKGWDEGVVGMKEGGKRKLVIPPDLGYGAQGAGGVIPPNATLVFEVELIKVEG